MRSHCRLRHSLIVLPCLRGIGNLHQFQEWRAGAIPFST
ncbi:hypothetical protein CAter282_1647 [Collimonas arenae]|uniref:Uncharacterized protein n=1 Tax=Collimonas arenae TaxID=279058 RepID=A0A127PQ66_9BURK|nr:hypothetical protein CAter10_1777 [Collimonas arenae]AMP09430.1 hypothetical protein CAter282_1647 [Collimonas arenae]